MNSLSDSSSSSSSSSLCPVPLSSVRLFQSEYYKPKRQISIALHTPKQEKGRRIPRRPSLRCHRTWHLSRPLRLCVCVCVCVCWFLIGPVDMSGLSVGLWFAGQPCCIRLGAYSLRRPSLFDCLSSNILFSQLFPPSIPTCVCVYFYWVVFYPS